MQDLVKDNAPWAVPVTGALLNKIYKATGLVVTRETPEKIGRDTYIEEIKKSNLNPLMKAAFITNAEKIIKEYMNQKDIVKKAIPLLTEKDKPENIDEDWLMAFLDRARLISDSEFQIIWAKILAEECREPGKISKQLLMTLAQMDKVDAEVFAGVCNFSLKVQTESEVDFHPLIDLTKIKTYYSKYNITSDKLRDLVALGLIDFEDLSEIGFKLSVEDPILSISYGSKMINCSGPCFTIGIGAVILKKTGKELLRIITTTQQPNFLDEIVMPYLIRYWENEKMKQEFQNTLTELDKTYK